MVGVVVPWRGGCSYREAAFAWVRARWPWPAITGEAEGPWCKASAVAAALARTDADILVISDADVFCDLSEAIEAVENGAPWAVPHRQIRRLTKESTAEVLAGTEPDDLRGQVLDEPAARAHPGGGIVVLRRETWEQVPLDPRFVRWGHEDDAWGWALTALVGAPFLGSERLWHLWHPPQERRTRRLGSEQSHELQERYWRAHHRPEQMRALVEEARWLLRPTSRPSSAVI